MGRGHGLWPISTHLRYPGRSHTSSEHDSPKQWKNKPFRCVLGHIETIENRRLFAVPCSKLCDPLLNFTGTEYSEAVWPLETNLGNNNGLRCVEACIAIPYQTDGELMNLLFRVQAFVSVCLTSLGPKVPKRRSALEPAWGTTVGF